jgi:hypothetical protein
MMLQADQARVKEYLAYDETSGLFTWKKEPGGRVTKVGAIAGGLNNHGGGYWVIGLDGRRFLAHRLAWLYVHGEMPPAELDHINGNRTDNRIANLRIATRAENQHNSRTRKSVAGLKGAHLHKRRLTLRHPWSSHIRKDGKRFCLGYFATAEEAHAAYVKAATELHGEFARTA